MQKYCSILNFLEDYDKEFFDIFRSLCIGGLLRPRGKAAGITLLYPKEKKYREEIFSKARGPDPEEAIDMIKALVLQDYLPETSDFATRKADIPNGLAKRIKVQSASADKVQLDGGLTLSKEPKFKARKDRKLCVYVLSGKGKMSPGGEKTAWTYSEEAQTSKKVGGVQEIRRGSIKDLVRADVTDASSKSNENPFAERCLSYYKYACLEKGSVSEALAKCLKPVPEMTYLCLVVYWESHYQDFHAWLAKTKGMYRCSGESDRSNVNKEYLRVYDQVVDLYYKDKNYDRVQADRRRKRSELAESIGAISTIKKLRASGAKKLWCDELPVVTLIPMMRLMGYEKARNSQAVAAIMKELHCSAVSTRPSSDADFDGTFSGRSFKGDVPLYLSATLAFVRSNAYEYQPLKRSDLAADGPLDATFVDEDGSVADSPFNLMGKLFKAQDARVAKPCFLGHF